MLSGLLTYLLRSYLRTVDVQVAKLAPEYTELVLVIRREDGEEELDLIWQVTSSEWPSVVCSPISGVRAAARARQARRQGGGSSPSGQAAGWRLEPVRHTCGYSVHSVRTNERSATSTPSPATWRGIHSDEGRTPSPAHHSSPLIRCVPAGSSRHSLDWSNARYIYGCAMGHAPCLAGERLMTDD